MRRNAFLLVACGCFLGSLGCAGEPTREEYRDDIAEAVCDRDATCGRIGPGQVYSTMGDCIIDRAKTFNDLWPSNRCDEGRINPDRYQICYLRARSYSCDNPNGEVLWFAINCNADRVCIDPRD